MALSYKDDQKQDERLDPYSDNAKDLYKQEQDAYDQQFEDIAGNHDKTADDSQENDNIAKTQNIDKAREREEASWKSFYRDESGQKQKLTFKSFMKKKGPMGLIITLLLGGGGGFSLLFSPGMLIVDLKEKMNDKFNDQLAAMDVRTTALIKKKFGKTTSGLCGQKLSIRCKYNSMSKRQFSKLEKAIVAEGGKINTDGKTLIKGRAKITSIEFGGKVIGAADFASEIRTNPAFRSAMMKGYNPKLAGFADSLFGKLSAKLGINKQKNIGADEGKDNVNAEPDAEEKTDEQKMKEELVDAASGEAAAEAKANAIKTEEECDGGDGCTDGKRTVYKDEDGKAITEAEYNERVNATSELSSEIEARRSLADVGKKATKATLKGALTSTALGLGAVDTACTGYLLIRTVGYAAKYLGMLMLLRYAHVFMNTADSIKAGDATPKQVEFVGNILTSQNAIGQSATDSYGYKYAAYGDVMTMPRSEDVGQNTGGATSLSEEEQKQVLINDETTKYINGQLVSDNILAAVIGFVEQGATSIDVADETCKFVKSGWGQTILFGTAIVGAVVAFFSGGASLGWGVLAQAGVGIAISVALAMLTPKLVDMAAGRLVDGNENGNQAGNAITSGMGGYNAQTSQGRGLPAQKKEDAVAYAQLTKETMAQYDAVDRLNANPLDASNPHTFMGTFVSNLIPYASKISSSLTSNISAMTQFTTSSFASLLPSASAAEEAAQYNVCEDRDYKQFDLAVDPFCNVRYGLTSDVLAIDPETVLDYMLEHDYVDEETGQPKEDDNDYAEYIKHCMERAASIGGFVSEDDINKGEECVQNEHTGDEEKKYDMFRLFYIDQSIDEGMENGYANSGATAESDNGQVVSPVAPGHTITSGYGPRGSVPGASNGSSWHAAIDMVSTPTDVYAAMAGTVVSVGGGAVNVVTIKHADGLKTRYLHMWPKDTLVKAGDTVTAGQKIGKIGCAGQAEGYCGGPHLDFNIWVDEVKDRVKYSKYKVAPEAAGGSSGNAINPANFLKDNGVAGYDEAVNDN
ncbi:MAG: M23 family metallopeptidase [Candidatus Saccharibacteria bacterium]|nr:MAG: M23 family metallopeptidase [Candidatus Saccharibacteria bacterium]